MCVSVCVCVCLTFCLMHGSVLTDGVVVRRGGHAGLRGPSIHAGYLHPLVPNSRKSSEML